VGSLDSRTGLGDGDRRKEQPHKRTHEGDCRRSRSKTQILETTVGPDGTPLIAFINSRQTGPESALQLQPIFASSLHS
jgi:hypothetical protein